MQYLVTLAEFSHLPPVLCYKKHQSHQTVRFCAFWVLFFYSSAVHFTCKITELMVLRFAVCYLHLHYVLLSRHNDKDGLWYDQELPVSNQKFPIQLLNATTQLCQHCLMWQWLEVGSRVAPSVPRDLLRGPSKQVREPGMARSEHRP